MDETKLKELVGAAVAEFGASLKTELAELVKSAAPKPGDGATALAEAQKAQADIHKALITLGERVDKLDADVKSKDARIAELSETAKASAEKLALAEQSAARSRIESVMESGLRNGTLVPADVPGFGKPGFDAVKCLSESRFGGVDLGRSEANLLAQVATGRRVEGAQPDAARRTSAPTGNVESASLSDVPLHPSLGTRDEAEKFASMGVGGDPRFAAPGR